MGTDQEPAKKRYHAGNSSDELSRQAPVGYELIELLGEGGFGTVYRAKQLSTGQCVALKMLRMDRLLDEQRRQRQIERFEREAQLSAGLHHPHIVKLLDKGQTGNKDLFAVFEYVPGETLKDLLLQRGALPAVEAGELMGQVLDALACAHAKGIVHRDLKPQNIMVTTTGTKSNAKVLDFGIGAFIPEAREVDYVSLTMTQEAVGTPTYSAPEQLRGEPPTVKSDLYAWGLVLLECLTGQPVMQGSSLAEIFHLQLSQISVPLPPAIAGHPLAGILRQALQKDPRERVENAEQLYEDFRQLHLGNLVGNIIDARGKRTGSDSGVKNFSDDQATMTLDSYPQKTLIQDEQRQITVLCCSLSLSSLADVEPELEALDTLQRDQMNVCNDTGVKFGGYLAGSLGGSIMIYFGYPHVSGNDVRRAARAALELVELVQRRSVLLEAQGIKLELRIGIHTGLILIKQEVTPTGLTPNIALTLERFSKPGSVLVSESTRKLLEQYIEFEEADSLPIGGSCKSLKTHLLIGERHTEALFFLSSESKNRKLIGRETEFAVLQQAWDKAKQKGHGVLVMGEPGIGKSRLVHELRYIIRQQQFVSYECRCLPEHSNTALYPILEMLKSHLHLSDASSPEEINHRLRSALQSCHYAVDVAMPVLCTWLALPLSKQVSQEQYSAEKQKQILLEVTQKLIFHLAGDDPFLFIVEDLHWIDPTSMELLERMVNDIEQSSLLLVLTARPEFCLPAMWRQENTVNTSDYQIDSEKPINIVHINKLSLQQAEVMIQDVLGKPIEKNTLAKLSERCDGVPLFMEELVRMLLDGNLLAEKSGVYSLTDTLNMDSIPVTLRDSLNERLDRLGKAKETAQLAATIGREFSYDLLSKASLCDEASVQTDIDSLTMANLIYRLRRVASPVYLFRHALIRDAAYDNMASAAKKQSHSLIANAMEIYFQDKVKESPAEVARHYAGAGDFEKAVNYGAKATSKQIKSSANHEALSLGSMTLNWVKRLVDSKQQIETELQINNMILPAITATEGWGGEKVFQINQRNEQLINRVRSLTETDMDECQDELTHKSEWSLFTYYHIQSERHKARETGERIIEQAKKHGWRRRQVAVLPILAQAYNLEGEFSLAKEAAEKTLELYDEQTDVDIAYEYGLDSKAFAYAVLSLVMCYLGYPETAQRYAYRGMEWSEKTGHVVSISHAYLFTVLLHYMLGDKNTMARLIKEHQEAFGTKAEENWVSGFLPMLEDWLNGQTKYTEQFIAELSSSGQDHVISKFETIVAETYLQQGKYDTVVQLMNRALARCQASGEKVNLAIIQHLLALAYYGLDQTLSDRVEEYFLSALEIAKKQQFKWQELEVTVNYCRRLCEESRKQEAQRMLEAVLACFSEGHSTERYKEARLFLEKLTEENGCSVA